MFHKDLLLTVFSGLEKIVFFSVSFWALSVIYTYPEEMIADFFFYLSLFGSLNILYNFGAVVLINNEVVLGEGGEKKWFGFFVLQLIAAVTVSGVVLLAEVISGDVSGVLIASVLVLVFKRADVLYGTLLAQRRAVEAGVMSLLPRTLFVAFLIMASQHGAPFYLVYSLEAGVYFLLLSCCCYAGLERRVGGGVKVRAGDLRDAINTILKNKKTVFACGAASLLTYFDALLASVLLDDSSFAKYIGAVRLVMPLSVVGGVMSMVLSKKIYENFVARPFYVLALVWGGVFVSIALVLLLYSNFGHFLSYIFSDKWGGVSEIILPVLIGGVSIFWGQFIVKINFIMSRSKIELEKIVVGLVFYAVTMPIACYYFSAAGAVVVFSVGSFLVFVFYPSFRLFSCGVSKSVKSQ